MYVTTKERKEIEALINRMDDHKLFVKEPFPTM